MLGLATLAQMGQYSESPPRSSGRLCLLPTLGFWEVSRTASLVPSSSSVGARLKLPQNYAFFFVAGASRDFARTFTNMSLPSRRFLLLLWGRIEACFEPKHDATWSARVATVLLHRCKGLLKRKNLSLARYVG